MKELGRFPLHLETVCMQKNCWWAGWLAACLKVCTQSCSAALCHMCELCATFNVFPFSPFKANNKDNGPIPAATEANRIFPVNI